jgi:hypothetical protein
MRPALTLPALLLLLTCPIFADESSPQATSPSAQPVRLGMLPTMRAGAGVSADLPASLPSLCKQAMDTNRNTRLPALESIGKMGPAAIRALPLLKQIMALGDTETRAAVRAALWNVCDPADQSRYFFEMDYRSDLERAYIYGPVKRLVVQNLDDRRRRETDYDTMGNRKAEVMYDLSGWERARTNYEFDPATGKWTQATLVARTGLLTLMMEVYFSPVGDRLREISYATDLEPKITRRYDYDGPRRMVRCEEQAGTAMDLRYYTFTLDSKGHVTQRTVKQGFQGPEEMTEMTFDARGNTTARWEYVSLPSLDGSTDPGPLKEQPVRRLIKYRFEYVYNDLDERTQQKMFWGDEVIPERISTFQWDEWRNIKYVERRDVDNNVLNENRYTWDKWHNELVIDEYDHSGKNSRNERVDFEGIDGWGNWTSRSAWGAGQRTLTNIRTFEYYPLLSATAQVQPASVPAAVGLTYTASPTGGALSPTAEATPVKPKRKHKKHAE